MAHLSLAISCGMRARVTLLRWGCSLDAIFDIRRNARNASEEFVIHAPLSASMSLLCGSAASSLI